MFPELFGVFSCLLAIVGRYDLGSVLLNNGFGLLRLLDKTRKELLCVSGDFWQFMLARLVNVKLVIYIHVNCNKKST